MLTFNSKRPTLNEKKRASKILGAQALFSKYKPYVAGR